MFLSFDRGENEVDRSFFHLFWKGLCLCKLKVFGKVSNSWQLDAIGEVGVFRNLHHFAVSFQPINSDI